MKIFDLFDLNSKLKILDVGAAAINEIPIYKKLLDINIGHLSAIDGDKRQNEKLQNFFGSKNVTFHNHFLFDGRKHKVYLCNPSSGMTSLFKPHKEALKFFNGFEKFGNVEEIISTQTTRLDEVKGIKSIDFLKMDAQGAELEIMKNGEDKLQNCLAIQLEVSHFPLYENQPSFGDIDLYLRGKNFLPHLFLENKKWSIAPTIFNNNPRTPGNQLLESDIVYIRNPLKLVKMTENELKKMAVLAHYSFKSPDLCVFILIEMAKRRIIPGIAHQQYINNIKSFS